ncbi:transglutaminase-like domain-containing protein [Nocardia arizonensis]|uniref:transglutaminase-like domain-containing protein n=1 Tax=Nocardia arizonensis TaxID=1141647 RepID=UPI0006CF22F6|nr:transglutaminase family protein [Nocardia arizonensis]
MKRDVSAHLEVAISAPATLEFQIAVARQPGIEVSESLVFDLDGVWLTPLEIAGPHGTRIHRFDAGPGTLRVDYRATVFGVAHEDPASDYDLALYRRPSRYAESDRFHVFAAAEFSGGASEYELAAEVSAWVSRRLRYAVGSSRHTDGAVQTLLSGAGVCRDFTHLTVALLRAVKVPARVVAAYAPGCCPMDFHAVVEAYVDGGWRVFDATGLAPRSTLVRIATGRDASDTAFLDNHGGEIYVNTLWVNAFVEGPLPYDDRSTPVRLG